VNSILHNHPNNLTATREVALGLVATCNCHTTQGQQQMDLLNEQNRNLCELVMYLMGQIQRQEGETIPIPEGYIRNKGNVTYTVPTTTGDEVVPIWIKKQGNGKVEMLAG